MPGSLAENRDFLAKRFNVSGAVLDSLCRRYGVVRMSVFGSAARDDMDADSDIDILVEFDQGAGASLIDMQRLREELEAVFPGYRIDITTPSILRNPFRRATIERDRRDVYAA